MTPCDLAEIIQTFCRNVLFSPSGFNSKEAKSSMHSLSANFCRMFLRSFYKNPTRLHGVTYYSTPTRLLGVWCQKCQTHENENYVLQTNFSIWILYFIETCVTVWEIKHEDEWRGTTSLFRLHTRIVFHLGHDRLLPNSFQSTIYLWPHNSHIVCDIESVAKNHQTIARSCHIVSLSVIFFLLSVSWFSPEDFLTMGRVLKEIGRNQLFIEYNISVAA
jgi:hypothetical protein